MSCTEITLEDNGVAHHHHHDDDEDDKNTDPIPSPSPSRRCFCGDTSSCSCLRALTVTIHTIILATAILCMLPIGVMTSVIRSYMSGIVTFVWLIYCCLMITANIVPFALRRFRKKDGDSDGGVDGEQIGSRVSVSCNEMGCLCFVEPPYSKSSCLKVPCPIAVTLLLIVEGILLLTPVFASISSYNSINNGAIDEVFPGASSMAIDPRATAFSFAQYMLPGVFSYFGGYSNNNDSGYPKTTLKYKDGCKPDCELDIHIPRDGASSSSGYPVIFHVHGGGWDWGDKSAPLIPITYWLDRKYAFVSIQYRFPSQTPGGATVFEQLDDVQDAFNYMTLIGSEQGLDTSRVLFFGDSAGGHRVLFLKYGV